MAQTQQSVSFTNGNQVLAGTLTMPPGTGVHPAVLIVLGSGSSNRDGEVEGLRPFQAMTTELVKKGFAVLRYDNRSKGRSPGKPIDESTTTELASDAQVAYRFLKGRKEIDSGRIGIIGHSEGATIAAIAASRIPKIRCLLALNGAALPGYEDILLTTEERLREAGTSDDTIRSYLTNMRLYLGRPASTPLGKRRVATRHIVRFEINRLPVDQRAKITKADIESAVDSQLHEVLSRWEQHYLSLNPANYYQKLRCPVSLIFSDSEVEGLLSKRLSEFRKVFNRVNQAPPIRQIKHADHNLITTDQRPKAVSSAFIKAVVEEAGKLI
ncbi:alpha/beta hydrolase family protein [Spirosoma pollinicola]|uniref:alpha/beta hydrolase family protein n=1 Tax=Spirosoma pollinicola TaxID=2057025 RepID=UPI0012FD322F|nr:alpha/beta hydrolase [Spirosoma pollinicola]